MDEVRFAGDEVDLAALVEEELIRQLELEMMAAFIMGREQERMREIMRFRADKLTGRSPAQLFADGWAEEAPVLTAIPAEAWP